LKPGKAPLAKIDAKSRSGNIDLELPESAKFDLKATTGRGEARNDFGPAIHSETSGPGASLKGTDPDYWTESQLQQEANESEAGGAQRQAGDDAGKQCAAAHSHQEMNVHLQSHCGHGQSQ
jgi:hypothetical protein